MQQRLAPWPCSKRAWICAHRRARNWTSEASSSSPLPSATVRTMNPPGRRAQALDDVAEALALVVVVDAARDADVAGLRHVDDVAAGNRDEGRDARALGPERLLGDLDEDLLAAAAAAPRSAARARARAARAPPPSTSTSAASSSSSGSAASAPSSSPGWPCSRRRRERRPSRARCRRTPPACPGSTFVTTPL